MIRYNSDHAVYHTNIPVPAITQSKVYHTKLVDRD